MTAAQPIVSAPSADRSRRGGRAGKRGSANAAFDQPAFRQLTVPFAPTKLISDDAVESIHLASLRVLAEIGVDVLHDGARQIMKAHGADVREGSERVRFDGAMIMEMMSHCPGEFTLHARNPAHNVRMGGNAIIFAQMASAPNCSDIDRGRRAGNQQDFRNLVRLGQMHNILNVTGGYPVEPIDIHPSVRHLECLRDFVTASRSAASAAACPWTSSWKSRRCSPSSTRTHR
jgi:trimethylamine--corrinoid protein Co-methyltransferase